MFESIMRIKMQVFLSSLGQCVSSIAVRFGTFVLLVRRDALLLNTKIPPHAKRSFRVLPLSGFGPRLQTRFTRYPSGPVTQSFAGPRFSQAPLQTQAPRVGVLLWVGG